MPVLQDAFISYGRADSKVFAIYIKERLTVEGFKIWLDLSNIPAATDFLERISDGIEKAHNFIYIISPSAVNSSYCQKELHLALRYNKRVIPLMHVDAIDQATWHHRNPHGTDADWQLFKSEGRHCSSLNMPPEIRKLNWLLFRESIDDLDESIGDLIATLLRHNIYVHQHTNLLTKALIWDKNHHQSRYLLVGKERQQSETWLKIRFPEEPLPCFPTDLHCEFINESTKNANNLMTQVFLCHSKQDEDSADQIRRSLLQNGITVWNYRTDIQTSQDFESAISQGLEEADNVVFLLSSHSAQSAHCQRELAQALQLNKRLIPVLMTHTPSEQMPKSLKTLQYVDFTDNVQYVDYCAAESQLLRILNTDETYYNKHKTLLAQAFKWKRQQRNPAMLLRGYNLRHAANWLKLARTHLHPPTELHETFISESLRQPPAPSLDVFISYSQVDSDFARQLNDSLQTQGKLTWFDQESIASGTDFQQEIYRGIESSDVFLFILSPQSVNSLYCSDEVEYAVGLNKRIITVLHRAIDTIDLHPAFKNLQWIDFRDRKGNFQANFEQLLNTLDTDREHLATHTRLLIKAGDWNRRERDESLLLRGQDLRSAEKWLVDNIQLESGNYRSNFSPLLLPHEQAATYPEH